MKIPRAVLVLPGVVGGEESILQSPPAPLLRLAENGTVHRLALSKNVGTPELAWLGLEPTSLEIAQGPLTVSAFGKDPPEGSVHFHLSLASLAHDDTIAPLSDLPDAQAELVMRSAERLTTRSLTLLTGEGVDNALVWEGGSLDLQTFPYHRVEGQPLKRFLPEGDGEPLLRRLIDDSVNLLDGLELNRVREDEGLPKANLLWPWGQGRRPRVDSLAIRRGEVVAYESRSLRLAGLVRLFGYRHGDRRSLGPPLHPDLDRLLNLCSGRAATVIVLDHLQQATVRGLWDEAASMLDDLARRLVEPLLDLRPFEIAVLALGEDAALSVRHSSEAAGSGNLPFDERALMDSRAPLRHAWEEVAAIIGP